MNRFTCSLVVSIILCLFNFYTFAQSEFITTWQITSNGESITIPTEGGGYDYDVDWGDTSIDSDQTGDASHTYAFSGLYTVKITGDFPRIFFNNGGDKDKILTVEQWGAIDWTTMTGAFYGCSNLNVVASDAPDLTGVVSLFQMFKGATSFDGEIDHWEVGDVTTMYEMFSGATAFDQPLNSWDVRKVTDMTGMFNVASSFNHPLDEWETLALLHCKVIFKDATSFNQDINSWVVTQVKDLSGAFEGATSFNQPLNQWNTNSATTMALMFFGANSFNQPINTWSVSKVTSFNYMFMNASDFDQSLSNWDVSAATGMTDMLSSTNMSVGNYDQTLIGWSESSVTSAITFRAIGRSFCASISARNDLGWVFQSDNQSCFQYITFDDLDVKSVGDEDFELTATTNTGLSVRYSSSNELVATVSGSTVTIVGAGSVTITASQSGNANYHAAESIGQDLVVTNGNQLITFSGLPAKQYGDSDFELTATSSSGLMVMYASSNESVATVSGSTVTIVGVGTTTITASQDGDESYSAAEPVTQDLSINMGDQEITFEELSDKTYGDTIFKLEGTVNSNLKISYTSSNTDVATVDGDFVVISGAGSTIITASQLGTDNFNAAADIQRLLVVNKATQTISFFPLELKTVEDDDFPLLAESSSGLEVSYQSSNLSVAIVSDGIVEVKGSGTTVITAMQKGDNNYLAAEEVAQDLYVFVVLGGNKEIYGIQVFPNPITNDLYVSIDEPGMNYLLKVVNQVGQVKLEVMGVNEDLQLNLHELASGVYFLQILADNGNRRVVRFIKE